MQVSLIDAGIASDVEVINQTDGVAAGIVEFSTRYRGRRDALLIGGLGMIGAAMLAREPTGLSQLTPISRLTNEYMVLAVSGDSEIDSLRAFLAWMRRDPDAVVIAGGNRGGVDHLFTGLIARAAGISGSRLRFRPFVGGIGAIDEVVTHNADAVVGRLSDMRNEIEIGRLRALAISSPQRPPGTAIPTCIEQGTSLQILNWSGGFAPPGLDEVDHQHQQALMDRMLASVAWRTALFQYNWESDVMAGAPFRRFLQTEIIRVRGLLASLDLS